MEGLKKERDGRDGGKGSASQSKTREKLQSFGNAEESVCGSA